MSKENVNECGEKKYWKKPYLNYVGRRGNGGKKLEIMVLSNVNDRLTLVAYPLLA